MTYGPSWQEKDHWGAKYSDEEEFNQFDEISPFATCELPRLTANDKTLYLHTDHNEKICVRSKSDRGRGRARGRGRGRKEI